MNWKKVIKISLFFAASILSWYLFWYLTYSDWIEEYLLVVNDVQFRNGNEYALTSYSFIGFSRLICLTVGTVLPTLLVGFLIRGLRKKNNL